MPRISSYAAYIGSFLPLAAAVNYIEVSVPKKTVEKVALTAYGIWEDKMRNDGYHHHFIAMGFMAITLYVAKYTEARDYKEVARVRTLGLITLGAIVEVLIPSTINDSSIMTVAHTVSRLWIIANLFYGLYAHKKSEAISKLQKNEAFAELEKCFDEFNAARRERFNNLPHAKKRRSQKF